MSYSCLIMAYYRWRSHLSPRHLAILGPKFDLALLTLKDDEARHRTRVRCLAYPESMATLASLRPSYKLKIYVLACIYILLVYAS